MGGSTLAEAGGSDWDDLRALFALDRQFHRGLPLTRPWAENEASLWGSQVNPNVASHIGGITSGLVEWPGLTLPEQEFPTYGFWDFPNQN